MSVNHLSHMTESETIVSPELSHQLQKLHLFNVCDVYYVYSVLRKMCMNIIIIEIRIC